MVEIPVRKKAVPNIQFCLDTIFLLLGFSLIRWLLLFCLLCSNFWPALYLSVDIFQGRGLRYVLCSHSLSSDLIQPIGFKYPLDTDKPQIYVTARILLWPPDSYIQLFKKYLKCSTYNTELLSLPPDMLNQVLPRSVMASPSLRLHSSNFGIIPNAFLSLIL